jgi:hypothetical protein
MKFIILTIALSLTALSFAQNEWQQTVNYKIDVQLDDVHHLLDGHVEMEYINNSPDALNYIFIHLWANAYDNAKTALGKQLYQTGNTILKYDNDSLKGCIAQLDFKINGQATTWQYDPKYKDIAVIYLATPLLSGGSLKITSPFQVKIPSGDISRLGHIGQSYQITQWYPKPAVYDKNGWHAMPYLNQGEFYSEYGSYDVKITLPNNYIVGSTGDLQNEDEKNFLRTKSAETQSYLGDIDTKERDKNEFPPSSSTFKTLHYKQSKVHDFAWFADKRFLVLQDEVKMPHSGRMVTTYAMFTPKNANLWRNASEYIKDGTYYYSLWNGDYPYNQVTAVDGTISAGGGMEYPNVTVIGNSSNAEQLEIVIVHEVGHNWFYGILGSNERDHGWMDEGLNTLNEIRYIQTKYPGNTRLSDQVLNGKFHFDHLDYHDQADFSFQAITKFGEDQPIETKSEDFMGLNYGIVMYQKTGLVFHYLKSYLGDELFDKCMSAYFEKWKFRHPQPEDLKQVLEETSGKNLDWLFHDLIQTTNHLDYKLCKVKSVGGQTEVVVKNSGQVNGPIPVTLTNDQKDTTTVWFEPGTGKRTILVPGVFTRASIDPTNHVPEINRQNNTIRTSKVFKKLEPIKLERFAGDSEPQSTNLFFLPVLGYNQGDNLMLGAAIHNIGVTNNPFQFYVAPMYSFNRQFVSGVADLHYTFLPKRFVKQTKLGVGGRTFKLEDVRKGNNNFYSAITPYLIMKLGNRLNNTPWAHEVFIKGLFRQDEPLSSPNQQSYGGYVNYTLDFFRADHQWETKFRGDYHRNEQLNTNATRGMITSTYRFRYLRNTMKKWLELRVFAGKVFDIKNANQTNGLNSLALSGSSGAQDLFFDDMMFNRSLTPAAEYTMRSGNQGGFGSTSSYGNSNDWMMTGRLYMDLPLKLLSSGPYLDYGLISNGTSTETAWNFGYTLRIRKVFQLSLPIFMSSNLENSFSSADYLKRIRVMVNLNLNSYPPKLKSLSL